MRRVTTRPAASPLSRLDSLRRPSSQRGRARNMLVVSLRRYSIVANFLSTERYILANRVVECRDSCKNYRRSIFVRSVFGLGSDDRRDKMTDFLSCVYLVFLR